MIGVGSGAFVDDRGSMVDSMTRGARPIRGSHNRYPQGNLDDILASSRALLPEAGVDLLVGTDVPVPFPASAAWPTAPACRQLDPPDP